MKPPIVVNEGGDITIYDSAESAALAMEAIDVINGEYEVHDSQGALLFPQASSIDSPVEIRLHPNSRLEPLRLQATLVDFVSRVGPERFGLTTEVIGTLQLAELIAIILRFQRRVDG